MQDEFYEIRDNKIVDKRTGLAIPDDEPVVILRASNLRALPALTEYANNVPDPEHSKGIRRRMMAFVEFRQKHPERCKTPGPKR